MTSAEKLVQELEGAAFLEACCDGVEAINAARRRTSATREAVLSDIAGLEKDRERLDAVGAWLRDGGEGNAGNEVLLSEVGNGVRFETSYYNGVSWVGDDYDAPTLREAIDSAMNAGVKP